MQNELVTGWKKSSYSDTGANCVETARVRNGRMAVRDSKDPNVGLLVIDSAAWTSLTASLHA